MYPFPIIPFIVFSFSLIASSLIVTLPLSRLLVYPNLFIPSYFAYKPFLLRLFIVFHSNKYILITMQSCLGVSRKSSRAISRASLRLSPQPHPSAVFTTTMAPKRRTKVKASAPEPEAIEAAASDSDLSDLSPLPSSPAEPASPHPIQSTSEALPSASTSASASLSFRVQFRLALQAIVTDLSASREQGRTTLVPDEQMRAIVDNVLDRVEGGRPKLVVVVKGQEPEEEETWRKDVRKSVVDRCLEERLCAVVSLVSLPPLRGERLVLNWESCQGYDADGARKVRDEGLWSPG